MVLVWLHFNILIARCRFVYVCDNFVWSSKIKIEDNTASLNWFYCFKDRHEFNRNCNSAKNYLSDLFFSFFFSGLVVFIKHL